MKLVYYTDGACDPNPGIGGWAYVQVSNDAVLSWDSGMIDSTGSDGGPLGLRVVL